MTDKVPGPDRHSLEHPRLLSVFSKIAKGIIYFPLGILAIGLLLAWAQYRDTQRDSERHQAARTHTPTRFPVPTLIPASGAANLSVRMTLTGPISCFHEYEDATISAAVLNRNIGFRYDTATRSARIIVRDDCIYSWDDRDRTGKKHCGIQPVLDMIEFMSSFQQLDLVSILANYQTGESMKNASDGARFKDFLSHCTEETPEQTVFDVPREVQFESTDTIERIVE